VSINLGSNDSEGVKKEGRGEKCRPSGLDETVVRLKGGKYDRIRPQKRLSFKGVLCAAERQQGKGGGLGGGGVGVLTNTCLHSPIYAFKRNGKRFLPGTKTPITKVKKKKKDFSQLGRKTISTYTPIKEESRKQGAIPVQRGEGGSRCDRDRIMG